MIKKALLIIGLVLTILVVGDVYWWIKTASEIEGFENVLKKYLSIFPRPLQNGTIITCIRMLLSSMALVIFIYLQKKQLYIALSIALISINSLFFIWSLFSLM